MKEATGELNSTIVVVMAVSVLMAFFDYTLWPIVKYNFDVSSKCSKAICDSSRDQDGYVICHEKNNKNNTFKCVYKG